MLYSSNGDPIYLWCIEALVVKAFRKSRRLVGACGERVARRYLRRNNYYLIAQNWRCNSGEIDIIALHNRRLVSIEVKSRVTPAHPNGIRVHPFDNLTPAKIRRQAKLSALYCKRHKNWLRKRRVLYTNVEFIAVSFSDRFTARARVEHRPISCGRENP